MLNRKRGRPVKIYAPRQDVALRIEAIDHSSMPPFFRDALGSGLIDHSQKMTVAAMQMADMKVCAQRS